MTLAADTPIVALPRISLSRVMGRLFGRTDAVGHDDCRQRRDDLLETVDKIANACACDESLAQMMYLYPGRY